MGKLALNVVLVALVPVALLPTATAAGDQGRALMEGTRTAVAISDLVHPPIVSPIALLLAITLAVAKPGGRVRRSRP